MSQTLAQQNRVGSALMCGSMAGFAFNDVFVKLAAEQVGLYQSIFIRGCFATLLIGCVAAMKGALWPKVQRKDQIRVGIRALSDVAATFCFLTALLYMPIANITAILQILPLTVTLAAAVFLGEHFGWRRAAAIGVGMIGVLLIIKPGTDAFDQYAILGLLAVGFVTVRDLIVRGISREVPNLFLAWITAAAVTFFALILTVYEGAWQPIPINVWAMLAISACFIFVGYFCAVAAMRVGEVAVVSSFRYTIMLWAIFLGWLIWGDIPDLWTWVGLALVISMGIFTLWREARA